MLHELPLVEIHADHGCNMTCESCSHHSNSIPIKKEHRVTAALARAWMEPWASRLLPTSFRVLGGEPLLNPELPEILSAARTYWPRSILRMTTNGLLLHTQPQLGEVLAACEVHVLLSIHHNDAKYLCRIEAAKTLLAQWRVPFTVEEMSHRWTRRYLGFGPAAKPFDDGDAAQSWESCIARECRQIFEGRLWKCSPAAYIRVLQHEYPQLSRQWDPYLAYRALPPDCRDEELAAFLARRSEPICGMCPAHPEKFTKTNPLQPHASVLRESPRPALIDSVRLALGMRAR